MVDILTYAMRRADINMSLTYSPNIEILKLITYQSYIKIE